MWELAWSASLDGIEEIHVPDGFHQVGSDYVQGD